MIFKASNFRGLKKADVDFDKPLCLIVGENESGKTSVIDAMKMTCGMEVCGVPAGDRSPLFHNEEKYSVKLCPNDMELSASPKKKPSEATVSAALGISRKALPFALDSERFRMATPKELKDLFAEVLQMDFDWRDTAVEDYKCDAVLVRGLSKNAKEALKEAEAGRRLCKKQEAPEPPEDFDVTLRAGVSKVSTVDAEALGKALETVEGTLNKTLTEKGTLLAGVMSDAQRKETEVEIASIKAKLAQVDEIEKLKEELMGAEDEQKQAQKDFNKVNAEQQAIEIGKEKYADLLGKFCEDCEEILAGLVGGDEGEAERLEEEKTEAIEAINGFTKEMTDLKAKIEAGDVTDLPEKVRQLEGALEKGGDNSAVELKEKEIEALSVKVSKGRKLMEQVDDYRIAVAEYKADLDRFAGGADQRGKWDVIVKAIPEIQKAAVSSGLTPLKEILDGFKFLDGKIEVSDDLEVTYNGRAKELMSDSAQYRLGIIMEFAILKLFNAPFGIVDRADIVVSPKYKKLLLSDLRELSKEIQVLLFQAQADARTDEMVEKGMPEGIALFQMKDGVMERRV